MQENPYRPSANVNQPPITAANELQIAGIARVSQVITLALASGILTITVFAIFQFYRGNAAANWQISPIVLIGWLMAGMAIPASFLVPSFVGQTNSTESTASPTNHLNSLLQRFQSQHIIGLSIVEGMGLLNAVAFMQQHHPGSAVMALVMFGVVLLKFPTANRIKQWVASRLPLD